MYFKCSDYTNVWDNTCIIIKDADFMFFVMITNDSSSLGIMINSKLKVTKMRWLNTISEPYTSLYFFGISLNFRKKLSFILKLKHNYINSQVIVFDKV